jgi:hypothetical protein
MTYHDELRQMRASVDRRKNAQIEPESYGIDDQPTLVAIRDALDTVLAASGDAKPQVTFKPGLKKDGTPEAWVVVKSGDEMLYVGDFVYTCPPRTDCA